MKIVEGTQSQSLQMKKLNTKFQYLSSSRYQDQKYLQYLQSLQKLNKQLISMLRNKDWQSNLPSLTSNIQLQNTYSNDALKQHKTLTIKLQKQAHEKNKEKIQMQQFYKRRIDQLNGRIDELRELMSDKQISFSKVLDRLTMYEELHQSRLQNKLDDFDFIINDAFVKKIISKISTDKHKLALDMRRWKKQLHQYKSECLKLKTAMSSRMNYMRYKEQIIANSEVFELTLESTADIEAHNQQPVVRISPDPIANAKNLVNLIKKQKMVNDSLERQFKQVIELNQDVINYNQLLTKSNNQKQNELRKVKAKISVLQKDMKKYENHFSKTLRKSKSGYRLEYNYLDLIEDQPDLSYLELLKQEIEEIDLSDAMLEKNENVKSYSVADVYEYERDEDENYFGEVEEF